MNNSVRMTLVAAGAAAMFSAASCVAQTSAPAAERTTANAVAFDPDDANYFGKFAPELSKTLARAPQLDPETGLYISEVKPNLFYVTDGVYQSAFLRTGEGVIVFDAPPSFAHKLPEIIREEAPGEALKFLVYGHDHNDHIGGASSFADISGLEIVTASKVAQSLSEDNFPGVIAPTITFDNEYAFSLGEEKVELRTASFHSEDLDVIIYLPREKFVMAVDTITPGEVPFMNFGATSDVGRYLQFFDEILKYDFDIILSGHVSILGTRDDVLENKAYAFDVRDTVLEKMRTFLTRFENAFEKMGYQNANLAYRVAMESVRDECAAEIIDRWQDRLSVVDVWADSHCETVLLYSIMH